MNSGIYKLLNSVNDNFYIGSAVDLKRRKARHFSELRNGKHSNRHLQAAWNRYGEAAFSFIVLEHVAPGAALYVAEDKWMADHVGKKYCYNIGMAAIAPMLGKCGVSSPTWGYRHTPESRAKIAAAGIGRPVSAETRAKRSAATKGRTVSEEQRAKISSTLSGEGNFWYGKKRPESFATQVRKSIIACSPDGEEITYDSIKALREAMGLTPTTVNRALKSGTPILNGKVRGWSFKYLAPTASVCYKHITPNDREYQTGRADTMQTGTP
jgi:group I intron endonuclease